VYQEIGNLAVDNWQGLYYMHQGQLYQSDYNGLNVKKVNLLLCNKTEPANPQRPSAYPKCVSYAPVQIYNFLLTGDITVAMTEKGIFRGYPTQEGHENQPRAGSIVLNFTDGFTYGDSRHKIWEFPKADTCYSMALLKRVDQATKEEHPYSLLLSADGHTWDDLPLPDEIGSSYVQDVSMLGSVLFVGTSAGVYRAFITCPERMY